MRLVNADAIPYKRDIVVTERFPKFGGFNGKMVYSVTKEEIDAMPTVDAVPVKHGRWIYHIDDLFPAESTQECDQCHEEQPLTCDDNFCPHCGAKMDGKDGEGRE